MKKEKVDLQNFQKLINKYLDGETTLEELKMLVNYYESYQKEHLWVEVLGSEEAVHNRILINILEELHSSEMSNVRTIPIYKSLVFKFAVAASLILFFSLSYLFYDNARKSELAIVEHKIKVGTNKAILTLANGSNVDLGEKNYFNKQNTKSNGKEIVYKKTDVGAKDVEYNLLTVPRGGQFSVKLSDGTQVWLNSDSQLKYPVNFVVGELRRVELVYGEAYFDVSPSSKNHGTHFLVFNNSQEIEVVGTEFNIKAYGEEPIVYTTLVEGKVVVKFDEYEQNLVPGQQLYLDKTKNTLLVKEVDVYNEISWKEGVFSFEDKTLKEVMTVLSRWYDIEVVFKDKSIENKEFVGVLRKTQELKEILTNIKNFGIIKDFKTLDKKVVLK